MRPDGREAALWVNGVRHGADREHHDVVQTARDVARVLALAGERLLAGDRILAGAVVHAPVGSGDQLVAEIEGLGRVTARIR
jgi:hypothetical protein